MDSRPVPGAHFSHPKIEIRRLIFFLSSFILGEKGG